ncbi:tehB: tellurite resistance protein TehB [Tepidimonas alkaliphilus]|uniref:TehB: tellurite resistance protein TehB n=1 Tax=Tepidimonas alkaliphilus TaxID=2588942 RepID=A0A554WA01_9BURK|nr:class I SAM-dependent methyltransferase [Tepidimonas alkaliphilus]TSE20403.1 tehB: tellurite resistance protein TehB [Tepidimonas alkaliphilus]
MLQPNPLPPSAWITARAALLHALHGERARCALDVACGHGRHARWLAQLGYHVTAVDRDADALAALTDAAPAVTPLQADLENAPWPLPGQTFDVVLVTNYLWRPLLPTLVASLAPGGVLLYETFAAGQETIGRPARAEFLLQPGELLRACAGLRVLAYEDGFDPDAPRFVQRIVALRPGANDPTPQRLPLARARSGAG